MSDNEANTKQTEGVVALIDIAGVRPSDVVFSSSPLAELTAVLHVLSEPAHHSGLVDWASAVSTSLSAETVSGLRAAEGLWRSARADFLLPGRPGRSLVEELDQVDRIDDEVYAAAALASQRAFSGGSEIDSPLTEPSARARAIESARARGPEQADFAIQLLTRTAATRSWIRSLLLDCESAFFGDLWEQIRVRLEADAAEKRRIMDVRGVAASLEAASAAMVVDSDHLLIDKLQDVSTSATRHGITLIPSVFSRPHVILVFSNSWRPVVQYPIHSATTTEFVPIALLLRRLSALANPARLRLCRTLARGPHTTGELATFWHLTAPEVSRHLAILNKAGLLTTERRGRYVSYALNLAASANLGTDFLDAIQR